MWLTKRRELSRFAFAGAFDRLDILTEEVDLDGSALTMNPHQDSGKLNDLVDVALLQPRQGVVTLVARALEVDDQKLLDDDRLGGRSLRVDRIRLDRTVWWHAFGLWRARRQHGRVRHIGRDSG